MNSITFSTFEEVDSFLMSKDYQEGWTVRSMTTDSGVPVFDDNGAELYTMDLTEYHLEDSKGNYAGVVTVERWGNDSFRAEFTEFFVEDWSSTGY